MCVCQVSLVCMLDSLWCVCVCLGVSVCARRVSSRFQGHSVDDRALALPSLTVDGNLSIPHLFSSLQPFHRVEALQWRLQRQQLTLPWRPYFSRRARRWRRFTSRQSPLDEKRPEKDWHRWKRSVADQLSTRPFFSLDLLFTGNIAAVPVANADVALASNDLAAFVAAAPTLQQRRQLAFSVRPANTKV